MSAPLTHYIVVRRDLDLGTCLAMVAHAAGESFYALHYPGVQLPPFMASETVAVVLGARNEGRLLKLANRLDEVRQPHVVIRETDGPYAGQMLAIGVCPVGAAGGRLAYVRGILNDFQMIKALDAPLAPVAQVESVGTPVPKVEGSEPSGGSIA